MRAIAIVTIGLMAVLLTVLMWEPRVNSQTGTSNDFEPVEKSIASQDYQEADVQLAREPENIGAIDAVAAHLAGNKLGIKREDLRTMPNPQGQGTFVYCPQTRFNGIERKVIWMVLDGQAVPLNGATKGSVTPNLPWPRDLPDDQWSKTGQNKYSPSKALELVF